MHILDDTLYTVCTESMRLSGRLWGLHTDGRLSADRCVLNEQQSVSRQRHLYCHRSLASRV